MIVGILHATFLTGDLVKARRFYEGVLGLHISIDRPDLGFEGAWYQLAPYQQLHLMALPNPEDGLRRPEHGGRDRHIALSVTDLPKLIECLKLEKIAYTQSKSGRAAVFCRDPDGNALEFIEEK